MRYTTIIDITENKILYKSANARLLYLHLVLKSGYHDNDRDLVYQSIRNLAEDVGMSLSATRHAIKILEKASMIRHEGSVYRVRKWLPEQQITARPKTLKQQASLAEAARRQRADEERERQLEIERIKREQALDQGKTQFMIYFEALQKKAAAGDAEAADAVRRNRKVYEAHLEKAVMKMKNNRK